MRLYGAYAQQPANSSVTRRRSALASLVYFASRTQQELEYEDASRKQMAPLDGVTA